MNCALLILQPPELGANILACVFRLIVAMQRRRENASERNRFRGPPVGEKRPQRALYAFPFRAAYTLYVFRRSAYDVV